MSKAKSIRVESIKPRVQFAYHLGGSEFRATVYKSAPNVYTLRWAEYEPNGQITERLTEMRGDEKIAMSYDTDDIQAGLRRCTKHGLKIQRPRGEFDCEPCFREYGQRARAAAKARKQSEAETGVKVRPETQAERAARLKREAADAKVDRLMMLLASQGKLLSQQKSAS